MKMVINFKFNHIEQLNLNIAFLGGFFGGNLQSLLAGDVRNEDQPGLNSMHTLFFNEHNRVATLIYEKHQTWNDDKIFQETRKIVIGEFQNIVYTHYLQIILGKQFIDQHLPELKLPVDPSGSSTYDKTVC
mgnify:CR=1 FL=1